MWLVRTNAVVPVASLRFSPLKHEIGLNYMKYVESEVLPHSIYIASPLQG
jgi:hypothetical protein